MHWTKMWTAAVFLAGIACGSNYGMNSTGYGGGGGGGGTGGTGGHTTSVNVQSNAFQPNNDTVATNATVTWTWVGAGHNVTFQTLNDTSATMGSGTYQVTFPTPGTYHYRCTNHSTNFTTGMVGTIVVQ